MAANSTLSPFSILRESYGLNRPFELDAALSALYMRSEDDLLRMATHIIEANPFGLTYASVRAHLRSWLDGSSVELQQGVALLVFLYIEYLRPFKSPKGLPLIPLRLYGSHPTQDEETDKQWHARCRAYIVQYMRKQVEAGEIQDTTTHRSLFAKYAASVGDLKANESVWYGLRAQSGALELLAREAQARKDQAQANRDAAQERKAANIAAMREVWDEARAKRPTKGKQAVLTAPELLRAAAGLIQNPPYNQPQLAERLTAIANKLEADK